MRLCSLASSPALLAGRRNIGGCSSVVVPPGTRPPVAAGAGTPRVAPALTTRRPLAVAVLRVAVVATGAVVTSRPTGAIVAPVASAASSSAAISSTVSPASVSSSVSSVTSSGTPSVVVTTRRRGPAVAAARPKVVVALDAFVGSGSGVVGTNGSRKVDAETTSVEVLSGVAQVSGELETMHELSRGEERES